MSGKGNVTTHAAEKAIEVGAKVITLSDTSETFVTADGITHQSVQWVGDQKAAGNDVADPPEHLRLTFKEGHLPWGEEPDSVLPCATQNEMDGDGVQAVLDAGATQIAEGANIAASRRVAKAVTAYGVL